MRLLLLLRMYTRATRVCVRVYARASEKFSHFCCYQKVVFVVKTVNCFCLFSAMNNSFVCVAKAPSRGGAPREAHHSLRGGRLPTSSIGGRGGHEPA